MPKNGQEVAERANHLREQHTRNRGEMAAIRAIMDGGSDAVAALLGDVQGVDNHMPSANLILSGLTRLGQKLGKTPDLRVDPPADNDSEAARKRVDKLERIVSAYDEASWLDQLLPQLGRWLPGYGFAALVLRERRTSEGFRYPHTELRDSFDTFPAPWTADNQPDDLAVFRRLPLSTLKQVYPEAYEQIQRDRPRSRMGGGLILDRGAGASSLGRSGLGQAQSDWENPSRQGVEVAEYYDNDGFYLVLPGYDRILEHVPNVLTTGPQFVVAKRHAFNRLVGQYDHVIGLMAMQAKLNLMAQVAMEDEVFAEALALDTPLPTPDGWTTMGDVGEGDWLIGSDGTPTEVTKATEVQTDRSCYRVTFEDGTSVVASDGHLWESWVSGTRQEPRVRTTQQMVDDGRRFRVPANKPWKFPEADLPIDPYMLGLWLGDGHTNNAIITASHADMPEVIGLIEGRGFTTKTVAPQAHRPPMVYVSEDGAGKGRNETGLYGKLRTNGLLGNKHVPAGYLRSSIEQRTELLQGLMDSDGDVRPGGNCRFSSTKTELAEAVMELLRSLGEVPVTHWAEDERARGGGLWLVTFTPRNVMPFRLRRKAQRVKGHSRGPDWVSIRSIEPVDSVPVRCISVSAGDGLFLAGTGAHTTHNTNIIGEPPAGQYRRGRFAVNVFPQGTAVQTQQRNFPFQGFEHVNRIEKQLRQTAGYPVTDDAQSPNSYVTGQGLDELSAAVDNEVAEYQNVISRHLQLLDAKRLEWDEKAYPRERKPLHGVKKGEPFEDRYTPNRDINGRYRTRRVYGMMAAWDDSQKIVGGMQLIQADAISLQTFQENLDGLPNVTKEQERIRDERAEQAISQMILTHAADSQSPEHMRALRAATEMLPGGEIKQIASKWLEESEQEQEEQAQAEAEQAAQPQGPPPDVPSVLARMTSGGQAQGGVQTQGPLR